MVPGLRDRMVASDGIIFLLGALHACVSPGVRGFSEESCPVPLPLWILSLSISSCLTASKMTFPPKWDTRICFLAWLSGRCRAMEGLQVEMVAWYWWRAVFVLDYASSLWIPALSLSQIFLLLKDLCA